jgi:hypothetical protein
MGAPRLLAAGVLAISAFAATAGGPQEPASREVIGWRQEVFRWHYNPANEPGWLEPGEGLALFQEAARQWAPCGPAIDFMGPSKLPAGTMDRVNVMGWREFSAPGMRGLTWRRHAGAAIQEADVGINNRQPQLQVRTLLRKVVIHEFGHALGLVHAEDCRAVMSFGAACGHVPLSRLPQQPSESDWGQCRLRYGTAAAPAHDNKTQMKD